MLALVWKSKGLSSGEALGRFKKELGLPGGRQGIGHTGTLDPFAEGVLLVGTDEGTKLLAPLTGLAKTYRADIVFGRTSATLDPESPSERPVDPRVIERIQALTNESLSAFLASRLGPFEQIPPAFSAIHVNGQRSYELARKGQAVELKARPATLLKARSLGLRESGAEERVWTVEVEVSSGTYIRCLGRDWAQELVGFPGQLDSLVRTHVGPFGSQPTESLLARKLTIQDLQQLFEIIRVTPQEGLRLKQGAWAPRPLERPALLIDEGTGEVRAWIEPATGKLGRLLLADPFG